MKTLFPQLAITAYLTAEGESAILASMTSLTPLKIHTQGDPKNPTLVFLHAFPFPAEMWREQLAAFSEKFHCVAPDLPGFGASELPSHPVTFEYYVDSILNYLEKSKTQSSVWCGLSMGGYLALRMYERGPGLCRALILCDTKAGADGNEAKLKRWSSIQTLAKSRSDFISAQWNALVGESTKLNTDLKIQFEKLISKVTDVGVAAGLVALSTRTDSTAGLTNIHVPTLILVGEEDKVTPQSEADVMRKAILGSQMRTIRKAGHLSNLENPKEFNDYLSQFLNALV